jgi:transcriptional regulator with XRE-family HTH domain
MADTDTRHILGKRLTAYRNAAGLSVAQLAKKAKTPRQYIYDIEAGKVNFTVDQYTKLLAGCGASFEELLAGTNTSTISPAFRDLFEMLTTIVNSGNSDLLHGVRVSLDAISDRASRLMKVRESPSLGVKQEARGDPNLGSLIHKRKRRQGTG